ncbi:MAG: hypothetical protein RLZZ387_2092 [Chloroflexota bacterium]
MLFLCFNDALRKKIQAQIASFPQGVWSRVRVRTLHSWCASYVSRAYPDYSVVARDPERLAIVRDAIRETRRILGVLDVFERDPQVFLDEIRLIKGCNLHDLDEYLDRTLARTGALSADDYAALFTTAQTYNRLLRTQRRLDFDDFAPIALAALRQTRSTARVDHVIIDEAQDLSETQITLGRSLARKSLLLIADQAQAIYRESQLPDTLPALDSYDVLLPESFRTTAEIFDYACRLLSDSPSYITPARHGPPPEYHAFRWADEEAAAIAARIQRLIDDGMAPDEIAVLARYRALLEPVSGKLAEAGLPFDDPNRAEPAADRMVHLLTIHAAKGREFRAVFVVGLVEGALPCMRPEMDRVATAQELALARRQLYVAMTRASEHLWLSGSEGQPSRLLYDLGFLAPRLDEEGEEA